MSVSSTSKTHRKIRFVLTRVGVVGHGELDEGS